MRVAFVVQRAGHDVNGGAESLCLQMAERMSRHWTTEVITTCALDYMEWRNHFPPGVEAYKGTQIRRFLVDTPRDVSRFDQLSGEVVGKGKHVSLPDQEEWMRAQGPVSSGLVDYLHAKQADYDAFFFFGYLYATTYFGLPLVQEKAFLAPLAHDEWPIHFPMWDYFFTRPRGYIFNTIEEHAFVQRRFPKARIKGPVVGVGAEAPTTLDPDGFRRRYSLTRPFLLYVGRIDASKGCSEMFDWFIRARNDKAIRGKLVLIGKEALPVPFHDDIIHLGFVSEQEKWDAMAACDWLVNPSLYESLSLVLLENWLTARPVLVNGRSEVLVGHCRRSQGGLWYNDYDDWCRIISQVDRRTKREMGLQGRLYVQKNYSWEQVEKAYVNLLKAGLDESLSESG